MTPKHFRIIAILITSAAAVTIGTSATRSSPPSGAGTAMPLIKMTKIGNPIWRPVDAHVFTAPIGTAESGYAEFLDTLLAILPPPNHLFHPQLGAGPGAPHQPPYDHELGDGIAALGYPQGHIFHPADFSNGQGIFLTMMFVPAPGSTGSSPDFESGPIIPNSLFPIHAVGNDYHNGHQFSVVGEFDVPPLDASLDPPFFVDGHSHFPVFWADNADFGPPGENLNGEYHYVTSYTDVTGNGWIVEARFTITP